MFAAVCVGVVLEDAVASQVSKQLLPVAITIKVHVGDVVRQRLISAVSQSRISTAAYV